MSLSDIVRNLSSLPYDHKIVCAIMLDTLIQKDKAESEIAKREFSIADKLVDAVNGDGGIPIANRRTGKPIDPNSRSQKNMSMIMDYLAQNNGRAPSLEVRNYVISNDRSYKKETFYNAVSRLTKKGKIVRSNGMLLIGKNTQ